MSTPKKRLEPLRKSAKIPRRSESTPGPKPDILKIDEDWQEAVKKSLTKKKPAEGWPKE
jgi:hypothetical protein